MNNKRQQLDQGQEKKLEKIVQVVEHGNLAVAKFVFDLEEKIDSLNLPEEDYPTRAEITEIFGAFIAAIKDISKTHSHDVSLLDKELKTLASTLDLELERLQSELPPSDILDILKTYLINEVNRIEALIPEKTDTSVLEGRLAGIEAELPLIAETPHGIRDKLTSLRDKERLPASAIEGLDILKEIPDIKRIAQSNANALPSTTTFFSLNNKVIGRAKNINFIEGSNASLSMTQTGDQMNVVITAAASAINSVYSELPSDSGDHITFTLAHTPTTGTERLFRGGARQQQGIGKDYTIAGNTITLSAALSTGEVLLADYNY